MEEDIIIEKFGLCPSEANRKEIRQLLELQIQTHNHDIGCGEYLRVLCFMLFYIGNVEDSVLIWRAKRLNMDTGVMIDVGLCCGAGYEQTINFIKDNATLDDMRLYLEGCNIADTEPLDKAKIVTDFMHYYGHEQ